MSAPLTYPDVERLVVDLVTGWELESLGRPVTVAVGTPSGWKKTESASHLAVDIDGEFLIHPVVARTTVRVTAWSSNTTEAKRLAHEAQGRLLAHVGVELVSFQHLTGVFPAQEPGGKAELASFTVRASTRSVAL